MSVYTRNRHTKQKKKKKSEPSEKQQMLYLDSAVQCYTASFSVCSTAKLGIMPRDKATDIVDPYNVSRLPVLQFFANRVKVVTYLCARGHTHSRGKHCKRMASRYKHMGKLQSAITLIQRRESTIPAIKLLVLIRSAYSYKNHGPKCSQKPHELFSFYLLFKFFFFPRTIHPK